MRIVVLADDLIWATRLDGLVRGAGADPVAVRSLPALEAALPDADGVVIDLTARAYDGIEAAERARSARKLVLAVGQHDDAALRRRARAVGAVFAPYRLLTRHDRNVIEHWIRESGMPTGLIVTTRPTIPAARYGERLAAARDLAAGAGFAAILVGVGADMRYLVGYPATPMERLTMLVIPAVGDLALVAPRLEAAPARSCPPAAAGLLPVVTWDETDDPHGLVATMVRQASDSQGEALRIAVSDDLPARHLLRLQERLPGARFELASPTLGQLRIVKDADEIALLTEAAHAADRVVAQIAAGRLVGRTEADVAAEVRERLIAEGHDEATFAIVASGPNSASPHHGASERVIAAGEPIVLDIGGTIDGYGSDTTRTLWVTGGDPAKGPDEQFRHLFGVLHGAQAASTASVRPRVSAESVDAAARRPIEAEGYGEAFFHRTGHGIGLEGHEDPYIVAGNGEELRPGMAFSIEPGIYLVGEYGARIEDIVLCGPDGAIPLNESPHELYVVNG
jgi:Xaa-Pro aminopeptidase